MTPKKYLDIKELVEYTRLAQSTLYKKVSKNEIPFIKIGKRTVFDIEQIDLWIKSGGFMPEDLPQSPQF